MTEIISGSMKDLSPSLDGSGLNLLSSVESAVPLPPWLAPLIGLTLVAVVIYFSLRGGSSKKKTPYEKKVQKRVDDQSYGRNWDNDEGINGD